MNATPQRDDPIYESLTDRVHGELVIPGDEAYETARSVWNQAIDKHPAVIVRCRGAADVIAAVDVARDQGLPLAVKGGGHHIPGHAVCDDGIVIDLAPMDGVRVNPEAKTVRIQAGATWGAVNHELDAFNVDIVGMPYDDVGVAGFTLGGGMGQRSRQYGLAIDNLRSVDVVTAAGDLVRASEDQHPDLFWALRGGSGNFGVVTSFEFECHNVASEILTRTTIHPVDNVESVLSFFRDFTTAASRAITTGAGVIQVPETEELPPDLHGETVVMMIAYYLGDPSEGEAALADLDTLDDPVIDFIETESISEAGDDPVVGDGRRNYWTNHYLDTLSADAIDTYLDYAMEPPTPHTLPALFSLGGAINDVDPEATAYPHRDAALLFELIVQWDDPDRDEECLSWARDFHAAMADHATGGEYLNNQTDTGIERVKAAYGDNYDRLVEIKNTWDPENLFEFNQNIEPTTGASPE